MSQKEDIERVTRAPCGSVSPSTKREGEPARPSDAPCRRRSGASWLRIVLLALGSASACAGGAPALAEGAEPTVADIVARNATARGGADAWQRMQTMVWAGHTESSNAPERKLPFLLELKRPARMRFEIAGGTGKTARIFDGTNGWKVRPDSSGLPDVQAYTDDELAFARGAQVIDGPLMDLAAKGVPLTRIGTDTIENRKAYVVDAKLPSGGVRLWIDAENYLELRIERAVQMTGGRTATSTIVFRDYRRFEGLELPTVIETGAGPGKATDKLVIEKVALNPGVDDKTFAKPQVGPRHHGGVVVDTRSAARPAGAPQPAAPPK